MVEEEMLTVVRIGGYIALGILIISALYSIGIAVEKPKWTRVVSSVIYAVMAIEVWALLRLVDEALRRMGL